jgi:hypothetical protein
VFSERNISNDVIESDEVCEVGGEEEGNKNHEDKEEQDDNNDACILT